jgi:oligosaccharide repeat unit polymerase
MAGSRINVAEREFRVVRQKSYLPLWLILCGFSLGLFTLGSRESSIVSLFLAIGYLGILAGFARTVISTRDVFNPLCFVLLIGLVRYSCPAFLLLAGIEPPEEVALLYRLMGLTDSDWPWAHVLVLTSLTGVVLGWLAVPGRLLEAPRLRFACPFGLKHAAIFGMLIGGAALFVFIIKNASLSAIVTGALRNTTVQEGTGIYFRFIYMMIAGSILLSAYLLQKNRPRAALIPVFLCTLILLPLGGRGRALTPLAAGLLLQWYRGRERKGWPPLSFKMNHALIMVPAVVAATWLFYFVGLYRGGAGLDALAQSLSLEGIGSYLQHSIFVEFGHLHSLAGAVVIGPGVLEGQTFLGSLTFPLSKFLPIPGRSAGVYIIETLLGFHADDRWGLHASLIGDAYLNFGLIGVMLIMPLFGMLMKFLYLKFRAGRLHVGLYAFSAVYGINIFLKSIEAWPHMLVGLVFMFIIIRLADFFDFRQRRFAQTQALVRTPS